MPNCIGAERVRRHLLQTYLGDVLKAPFNCLSGLGSTARTS